MKKSTITKNGLECHFLIEKRGRKFIVVMDRTWLSEEERNRSVGEFGNEADANNSVNVRVSRSIVDGWEVK